MKNGKGGSLQKGVSESQKIDQKMPRSSGEGERPPKGSGTTINGGHKGKKKDMS